MLFSPLVVRGFKLRNRIVLPPMVTNMERGGEQSIAWYRARARGGAALAIVEATPLDHFDQRAFPKALERVADAIHEGGAVAAIQLFHPGRVDGVAVSVSGNGTRAIATEEVRAIPGRFAGAAKKAVEAGFDGVEPHGAHGFFLNQFFSPKHNQRTDEYGGNLQGRMRLGVEIVRAVRESVGPGKLVLYRHTPQADYPLEDSLVFAPELESASVDILDVSPSWTEGQEHAALAAAVKARVSCPVIAVGGMENAECAEEALEQGKADLVAIGRSLIADADLPRKWRDGRTSDVIACVKCDEACFGNLRDGVPIGCTQNPEAGHEYEIEKEGGG
jgi:2,4-dienoyl-CoA reductase-like NADH-dependent reductase (Old Yellow Enzyme family)